MFVDQICDDGVVTEIELDYINEKAEHYNVPETVLEKMISTGLFNAKLQHKLFENKDFKEIAYIYIVSHVFNLRSVKESIYSKIFENSEKNLINQLTSIKEYIFKIFRNKINTINFLRPINIYKTKSIYDFYKILGVSVDETLITHKHNIFDKFTICFLFDRNSKPLIITTFV